MPRFTYSHQPSMKTHFAAQVADQGMSNLIITNFVFLSAPETIEVPQ